MNDFGINITGFHGVLKPNRAPNLKTKKERTFVIMSGSGCSPEPGTNRKVSGKWLSDGMREDMSSYDFAFVINPETNEQTNTLPEAKDDTEPVKLASEIEAQKPVRRKRD